MDSKQSVSKKRTQAEDHSMDDSNQVSTTDEHGPRVVKKAKRRTKKEEPLRDENGEIIEFEDESCEEEDVEYIPEQVV